MRSLRKSVAIWTFSLLMLAAIGLGGWAVRSRWGISARSNGTAEMPAGYVADLACAECHGRIADEFQRSAMGQAWRAWPDARAIEDRSESTSRKTTDQRLFYQTLFRDGSLSQREFCLDEDGAEQDIQERQADYVLGSGAQGRTYISSTNGYLTIMPLGWYTERAQWDFSPGYEQRNLRFTRPVSTRCISCHNAMVGSFPGAGHAYAEPLSEGLGCQRCHGPGAHHVAMQSGGAPEKTSDNIVNPAKLTADLQQDTCLQCHLSGAIALPQPGNDFWSFRPGQRLRDVRSDFIDHALEAEVQAVGHGPRSMASACYQKSAGRMTCIFCHDPHKPTSDFPRSFYNSRCLECHSTQSCTRPPASPESENVDDCVSCHMPRSDVSDIPHVAVTEHWIRSRPKQSDQRVGSESRLPLQPFWTDTSDGQVGAAYVEYYGERRQLDAVQQGMRLLVRALEKQPRVGEWQYRLGVGYFHLQEWRQALTAFQSAVRYSPKLLEAHAGIGETWSILGDTSQTIESLEQTLERWPWYYRSDVTLVRAHWQNGNPERILELEDQFFHRHPDDPERLEIVAMAMERVERPFAEVRAVLERAIRADATRIASRLLLARMALTQNDRQLVEQSLRGALRADPESSQARIAWAGYLASRGNKNQARIELEAVLQKEPGNLSARQMLKQFDY